MLCYDVYSSLNLMLLGANLVQVFRGRTWDSKKGISVTGIPTVIIKSLVSFLGCMIFGCMFYPVNLWNDHFWSALNVRSGPKVYIRTVRKHLIYVGEKVIGPPSVDQKSCPRVPGISFRKMSKF